MSTDQRIDLARTWLRASREDLAGPSNRWQEVDFDRYDRDLGLLIDFLTSMEDELWPKAADQTQPDDICGLCGKPGADKYKHPCHWPGEINPEGEFVHAECEQAECARAHAVFMQRVGPEGVRQFLLSNS